MLEIKEKGRYALYVGWENGDNNPRREI
jgi:hypothetical protein